MSCIYCKDSCKFFDPVIECSRVRELRKCFRRIYYDQFSEFCSQDYFCVFLDAQIDSFRSGLFSLNDCVRSFNEELDIVRTASKELGTIYTFNPKK